VGVAEATRHPGESRRLYQRDLESFGQTDIYPGSVKCSMEKILKNRLKIIREMVHIPR
jgi:hypothetical protein